MLVGENMLNNKKMLSDTIEKTKDTNDIEILKRGLKALSSIPLTSPFRQSAQTELTKIKSQIDSINIESLYTAADSTGLKGLILDDPMIAKNQRYIQIMAKVKTILEHFDKAEVALKSEHFFAARDHWKAIIEMEQNPKNIFNVNAKAKLQEWTIEKLGRYFSEKGKKARRDKNYQKAREAFEIAKTRCDADVTDEIKSLRKLAYDLYIKAQIDKSSQNIYAAREKAEMAKSCLLPGKDAIYPKIETFIRNLNTEGKTWQP